MADAPAPFATWTDFEVRLKTTFTDPERKQVEAFIADVSALVRVRRPLIDSAIAAGRVSPAIMVAFIFQVANRMVASAGRSGLKSEQLPEWSYTLTDAASRGLYFTDDELAMLSGALPTASAAAYSVPLYR